MINMANFKTSKNILHSKTEYSRYFSAFRGVDFSSDHTEVNDFRFAYAVNMYKDYRSGQGDAVETIPGFRRLLDGLGDKIYGIHVGLGKMFIHAGNTLWLVGNVDENNSTSMLDSAVQVFADMSKQKSTSFYFSGTLYILDGTSFLKVDSENNVTHVKDAPYVPLTYDAIDPGAQFDSNPDDIGAGREHEQRNILTPKFRTTFVANGEIKEFQLKNEIDIGQYSSASEVFCSSVMFPDDYTAHTYIELYQYGVKIPWAMLNREIDLGNGATTKTWGPPDGYPNGIVEIKSDGTIILADPPPAPQDNTWNPTYKAFDYSAKEIADFRAGTAPEDAVINRYDWRHAYPAGYAGIEVVVKKATKAITGISPANGDAASIIEKCTIATVFDNRIFLSGNPEYSKHIFWSGIVKETGRPDPTYFGILNYDQEGVGDAPVVAMMPVADTLMVLKRDSEGEGSVLFHTASSTGEDVYSRMYPSTQGLYGVGCLGPCINFRDDPIFLSKYGVEAMGQLSVRYERAIEHRSSLIDAKLINCGLRDASIAEWEGYLLVLSKGRIFMADSRQMFTHESGVNQYEWYYLEDIGVWDGQFDEYVYAAVDITSEALLSLTGGVEIHEASRVRGYDGTEEDLIGSVANVAEDDVKSLVTSEGKTAYYRELPERDERGNLTGNVLKYYVEKSGAKTGGKFDAAVMLKVVGGDIFFATEGGVLCKFNFDMRDKESGIIPNEYYDFDGRRIFSGIATKMDNCGIPHLTKNTVKRSTVIKTRTFKNSSFKVKVRTNRKSFHQVGRIINGRAVLEDTDFSSFTFSTEDKSLFSINEKEKKWVEKQHFIYSDEFRRPFAIHYLAYRYNVAGQYKE